MTARDLVNFTRDLVGVYDRSRLADGFGDEGLTADRSVLRLYNEGLRRLLDTGYSECYETLTLNKADTDSFPYEYGLPTAIHHIVNVRLGSTGNKLTLTSIQALDQDKPGWRSATRGTVTHYYLEGHFVGVYPKPTATTETLIMLVHLNPTFPTAATDEIARIPENFQTVACHYAASVLSGSFASEAKSEIEMQMWLSKEQKQQAEFETKKTALAEWVQARHTSESDRRFLVAEPRSRRRWGVW